MRQKKLLVLLVVILSAFLLSGCGVNPQGVDIMTTPPDGLWQQLVVWPLGRALIWLDGWLQSLGVPYHWGFAIILFTVIVKIVTFPLTISQMRGMQAQKDLQPKIQELQKKYGKDREKISQEQMKLYQEAGVNPLSGCLPLLIQMPILFGLYAALVAIGPHLANASFFWIPDLAFPSYSQGMSWLTEAFQNGDWSTLISYLILPVLLMITQFIMQKWMTPAMPQQGDSDNPTAGMTKQLTYMMTFMFGFFTLQVPAGLTLYWVTSNLLQMLQQWLITSDRFGLGKPTPKLAVATATAGNGNSSSGGSSSSGSTSSKPTVVTPTALPDSKTAEGNGSSSNDSAVKAKEARRRRAKRR